MKIFKHRIVALSVLAAASFTPMARAIPITAFTATVGTGATQQGRLVRGGVPQDWNGTESFPGVNNPGVTFNYRTFTYNSASVFGARYIDISVYDELNNGNFFVSAYANSYNPTNLAANWLGDVGTSGNIAFYSSGAIQTDARFFDVILPVGGSLILVVNNTASGGVGNSDPFDIAINAFTDANYTEPSVATTPEPSTFVMLGTGLVGAVGMARRRMGRG